MARPTISRERLRREIKRAASQAKLPLDDRTALLKVARTAERVARGSFSVYDLDAGETCGCPITLAGLWTSPKVDLLPEGRMQFALCFDAHTTDISRIADIMEVQDA